MKYIVTFIVVVALGVGVFVHALTFEPETYSATATSTPQTDVRDNPQKIADNLAEAIRQVADARATLQRAQEALNDAQVLENDAIDNYNDAICALNAYQNIDCD